MKVIFKKLLVVVIIPLFLSISMIGVGFSLWNFNNDTNNNKININVDMTDIEDIGYLKVNYSKNVEDDTLYSDNNIYASDSDISFLYNYYVHFELLNKPTKGYLSFPFSLKITSKSVKLDDTIYKLLTSNNIISATSSNQYIGIDDMIHTRWYCAYSQDDCEYELDENGDKTETKCETYKSAKYELNGDILPFNSYYFNISGNEGEMQTFTLKDGLGYFRHDVDYPFASLSSFYCESDSQIYMTYNDTFSKILSSSIANNNIKLSDNNQTTLRNYIITVAREVLENTSIELTYKAIYYPNATSNKGYN